MPVDQTSPQQPEPASLTIGYASPSSPPTTIVVWCRLFALWLLVNGAIGVTEILEITIGAMFGMRPLNSSLIVEAIEVGLPMMVWLLAGWYCWYRAPSLAARIAGSPNQALPEQSLNPNDLLQIALIALGVYFFGEGIPGFARVLSDAIAGVRQGSFASVNEPDVVMTVARCLLGLWLILGTPGVARLIRKHSGRWHDAPTDSNQDPGKTPD